MAHNLDGSDQHDPVQIMRKGEAGSSYGTLDQQTVQRLRGDIRRGILKPGARIRQDALATQYGISRSPIREALRQLETEGLVVLEPHVGARVARLDLRDVREIFFLRERLEPLALSE